MAVLANSGNLSFDINFIQNDFNIEHLEGQSVKELCQFKMEAEPWTRVHGVSVTGALKKGNPNATKAFRVRHFTSDVCADSVWLSSAK